MAVEAKEKKQWKKQITNVTKKDVWEFPTMAMGKHSGIVVMMHGKDPETGEGHGTVLITEGDRKEGDIKYTWQLKGFDPIDGTIETVEVVKKEKA